MDVKSLTDEQKLKLTIYNAVSDICDDVGVNNTYVGKFSVAKDAKAIITELIYKKMKEYGEDLEAFAQHAKRSRINMEDVALLLRRREQTEEPALPRIAHPNSGPLSSTQPPPVLARNRQLQNQVSSEPRSKPRSHQSLPPLNTTSVLQLSSLATSVEEEEQEEQNDAENTENKGNNKKRKRGTASIKRGAKK